MEYPLHSKINQVIIDRPDSQFSIVKAFSTKPAPPVEKKRGRLFGLIEVRSAEPTVEAFIDFLIQQIKTNYYQPADDDQPQDLESRFETALQKTNIALAAFLETEPVALKLTDLNAALGVVTDQQITFTHIGKINILLLQYLRRTEYRIIDILDATQAPNTGPSPLKIFSQVVSGKIRPRDVIILATNNILDYFSLESLRSSISQSIGNHREGLKKMFQSLQARENFGVLTIELEKISLTPTPAPVNDLTEIDYQQAAEQDSMRGLIRTEQETQKLLTPSLLPELKKYGKILTQAFNNYTNRIKDSSLTQARKVIRPPKINLPTTNLTKNINRNLQRLQKTASPLATSGKQAWRTILQQPLWRKIAQRIVNIFRRSYLKFKRLPRASRIILILIIVLGLIFLYGVVGLGIKNARQQRLEHFNETITAAEMKKNESESSLIFRDENLARQQLIEAKNLLAALAPTSANQTEQIARLTQEIENQLQQLRHIITVDEPLQIINFSNLDGQADLNQILVASGSTVYTQNRVNQSLYKGNVQNRSLAALLPGGLTTGTFNQATAVSGSEIVFLNDANNVFSLNPTSDSLVSIIVTINNTIKPAGLTSFNGRIYLLDPATNQIYRYAKTATGYGNSVNWISDDRINLTTAVDLAVDGAIYVLKKNGQVIKLENGSLAEFPIASIDPAVTNATKLKTTIASNFLYILDPSGQRVIVLSKAGQLISQYTSPQFNNLKDLVIAENEQRVYVLNGNTVFGVPLSHL